MLVKIPGDGHWLLRNFFTGKWEQDPPRVLPVYRDSREGVYGDSGTFAGPGIGDPGSGEQRIRYGGPAIGEYGGRVFAESG